MDFIATKDLKAPVQWRKKLNDARELVVTNNGKPVALMLPIDRGSDVEPLIRLLRQARAQLALERIRESARASGTMGMSLEEINEEIAAIRSERVIRKNTSS